MKNKIFLIVMSFLFFSCSKNELTELNTISIGTYIQSITPISLTTSKVLFLLDGVPKSAIATETTLKGGITQYRLANGLTEYFDKNKFFKIIKPAIVIYVTSYNVMDR